MSTITAAQFLRRLLLITVSCLKVPPPFFLFSSLSEPPSISIALLFLEPSPLHANHLLPALCSVRSYFPDLSQSIFLIVLSPFSGHSANYQCQGRVCARVPVRMMNSCKSFHHGKCRLIGIFKAFTYAKIHCETPAKTFTSFSFNPRH